MMVKKELTSPRPKPVAFERIFSDYARSLIAIEMTKRQISYRGLTERYNAKFGRTLSPESESNMRNKISRGTFSASFFLMCLYAMDVRSVAIADSDLGLVGLKFLPDGGVDYEVSG